MFGLNVLGIIICSQAAKHHLSESRGKIVIVVMDWNADGINYTLTKTNGAPLTRGFARNLAPSGLERLQGFSDYTNYSVKKRSELSLVKFFLLNISTLMALNKLKFSV